jgi:hypothetical protein
VESEPGQWVVDKVPAPVQMDLFGWGYQKSLLMLK